ncbi:MAG: hypothetical protein SNJ71_07025 [Bacteroidales bacterium]
MNNEQIARMVLSIILGENVVSLQSKPQETPIFEDTVGKLARYDFKAIIRNEKNEDRCVLIELQKYNYPNPIMRFREYLAESYKKEETVIDSQGNEQTQALPIITIYILGYKITQAEVLALKIDTVIKDLIWDTPLNEKPRFVELLNHASIVLQPVAKPAKQRNTRLEKFLNLFTQKLQGEAPNYIIDIDEEETAPDVELSTIVGALNRATLDEQVLRSLKYEERMQKEYRNLEEELKTVKAEKQRVEAEKEKERTERLKAEQKATQAEQKATQAEQKASEAEQKASEAEQKASEAELKIVRLIKKMYATDISIEEIAEETGKTIEEVRKIVEN